MPSSEVTPESYTAQTRYVRLQIPGHIADMQLKDLREVVRLADQMCLAENSSVLVHELTTATMFNDRGDKEFYPGVIRVVDHTVAYWPQPTDPNPATTEEETDAG